MLWIPFWAAFILFVVAYLRMRRLIEAGADYDAQLLWAYTAGAASWFILAGLAFGTVSIGGFLWTYFTGGFAGDDMAWQTIILVGGGMLAGMGLLVYDVVPSFHFREFFLNSLLFRGYAVEKHDMELEIEKQEVYSIYDDYAGNPLPEDLKLGPARAKKIEAAENFNPALLHRDDELRRLKDGESVDITETWVAHRHRRLRHPLYAAVSSMVLLPMLSQMHVELAPEGVFVSTVSTVHFREKFEKDLTAFLNALMTEEWLIDYRRNLGALELFCSCDRDDAFAHAERIPFLEISAPFSRLESMAGKTAGSSRLREVAVIRWADIT